MARFQIQGLDTFYRWEQAAKRASRPDVLRPEWEQANEIFFDRTQQYVHVITGDLKSSGRQRVVIEGGRLVGYVQYGDGTVDYAQAELDRGGDHDFLGRGWEATQVYISALFGKMWIRAFDSQLRTVRAR